MFADIGLPPCLWGIPFHCSISLIKTQIVLNSKLGVDKAWQV